MYSVEFNDNKNLLNYLTDCKMLKSIVHLKLKVINSIPKSVGKAMLEIDRSDYVLNTSHPYMDCSQSIGYGATISSPHMHAICLEALCDKLKPGCKALDVGSGSGYLTAAMASMVAPNGKVWGIDHNKDLEFLVGDGRFGFEKGGKYDAINVGAAAKVIPNVMKNQLKIGGKLLIPLNKEEEGWSQALILVERKEAKFEYTNLGDVRFEPLIERIPPEY